MAGENLAPTATSNYLNWADAENYCQGQGAHLASVHSAEESNFLTGLTSERHWLGGTDVALEGNWVWSDGTAWTFTDWTSGEPNNGAVENCLMKKGTQWNDDQCGKEFKFVCKFINRLP